MEENRLKIRVSEEAVTSRAARRRRGGLPWLLIGGALLVLTGIGIVLFSGGEEQLEPSFPSEREAAVIEQPSSQVVEPLLPDTSIADDGQSLWVSPTAGGPIDLGYLLPGTQLVLHVRVAELLSHVEGEKVLAALGPWGERVSRQLTNSTGVELAEIETLLLGIRPGRGEGLEYALRVGLVQAKTQAELRQRLQNGQVCFLPKQAGGKVLVFCLENALPELKSTAGQSPLFSRELQRILQRTDKQRMATLVFAGKFLQISGEKFLRGTGELLREALIDFLGDDATATALSLHWEDDFFLELQSTVALSERPHRFAALLEERVVAASDRVEDVILAEPLHPYGRKVLARFPAMLRKLGNYTRSGEVEGLGVLRCYLPVTAGHNLVMGVELLVGDGNATSRVASFSGGGDVFSGELQSLGQRLQHTTSLVFPKETLQRALEMLAEDVGVPLVIAGRDLQLEGITKNQSFGIELRDQPAAEILLAVLLRANPDRTASGPSDVKQKLVYVVRETEVVVTTRAAAAGRGEKLPAVFEPATR